MPEIVEVELIKRGIQRYCLGKSIVSICYDVARCMKHPDRIPELIEQEIRGAERHGKSILLDLGEYKLLMHMMMSGQILYSEELKDFTKHTRVIIAFSDQSELRFNDIRKFGYVSILHESELDSHPYLSRLGLDPLSEAFTEEAFLRLTYGRAMKAKTFLLHQDLLSGIGNIYADEILFCAGIRPRKSLHYLSKPRLLKLYRCIKETLHRSLELGGSTRRDYLQVTGERGSFLDHAFVYARENKPCRVCGTPITKIFFGGRGTHYCKSCQS